MHTCTNAPGASALNQTIQSNAAEQVEIFLHNCGQNATSASLGRRQLQRSTGGTTPTTQNEEDLNSRSSDFTPNPVISWVTAPTLSGNALVNVVVGERTNATGRWRKPRPNAGILIINGEQLDVRGNLNTANTTMFAFTKAHETRRLFRRRSRHRYLFSLNNHHCSPNSTAAGSGSYNHMYQWGWHAAWAPFKRTFRLGSWITLFGLEGTLFFKSLSGSIAPSGILLTKSVFKKALAGSITPSGALIRKTLKQLAGTISSSGTLVNKTFKILSGQLNSSGSLRKKTFIRMSGVLTPSGILTTSFKAFKALFGSITPSGTLSTLFIPPGGVIARLPNVAMKIIRRIGIKVNDDTGHEDN